MKRKGKDTLHGVLLLDKPAGYTSNGALQSVKRLLRVRKAGHTGSLDPIATGLLPICLGEATKLSGFLLESDKGYEVAVRLGVTTNTGDSDGHVLAERPVPPLDIPAIDEAAARFRGTIEQIPHMFSAIKQGGQPLYELAREGREVERQPRQVIISELTVVELTDDELILRVACSKGTYIRSLVEDLGDALGCGAHVVRLRRTAVGGFEADDPQLISLEALGRLTTDAPETVGQWIKAPDTVLQELPRVALSNTAAYYLRQGQAIQVPKAPTSGLVRVYDEDVFVGVGKVLSDGRIAPKRLLHLQG